MQKIKAFFKKSWAYIALAAMFIGFVVWLFRSRSQVHDQAIKQVAAEKQLHEVQVRNLIETDQHLAMAVKAKEDAIVQDTQDQVIARFHQLYGG